MAHPPKLELRASQLEVLDELLGRWERSSGARIVSVRVSADRFPAYFAEQDPPRVREWEDRMRELEALGWVALDTGKGQGAHRIERIRLVETAASEIARITMRMSLGEFRAGVSALHLRQVESLSRVLPRYRAAWESLLRAESDRWARSMAPADRRRALLGERETVLTALNALLCREEDEPPCSWRQFCVILYGDSKRLDPFKSEICRTLAREILVSSGTESVSSEGTLGGVGGDDAVGMAEAAVLSHFGIWSKESVVLIHGPLTLNHRDAGIMLEGERWSPFLTVPESLLDRAEIASTEACRGVISIENEESFHAWCRQRLRPDWICVYLGGFPSRSKLRFLRRLRHLGLPIKHWGDLDCGGIEILLFLERELAIEIEPIGMAPHHLLAHAEAGGRLSASELRRLDRLAARAGETHAIQPLIHEMRDRCLKLEQEAIVDPFDVPK